MGITRARRFLALSSSSRRPSRFLTALQPGRKSPAVRILSGAPMSRAASTAAHDDLFDALRAWRRDRAAADGVPAYIVAHDTVLAEIAELRPHTLPALRRVRGMGPTKLERYGPEILAVVGRGG